MKIDILCSDCMHPINIPLRNWVNSVSDKHKINIARNASELEGGDMLFLVSAYEIINKDIREAYGAALILHASALPEGRGWSPHIWQIIEGSSEITVTLLEAEDAIDSGAIWSQLNFNVEGHELADEINEKLFSTEFKLIEYAIEQFPDIKSKPQKDRPTTYYKRRTPEDSQLDPEQSIGEQFDLLRVVDNLRYPAFFNYRGHRYYLTISKDSPND